VSARIYIPKDSGAVAVGADDVAKALADAARRKNVAIDIVRTGTRGL
jgi:formate dehydrogenase iron-sulfur subunit